MSGTRHALMFIPIAREVHVREDLHDADPDWAHALVYASLELHLPDMCGPLTEAQLTAAEDMAAFLLDDELPAMGGPPSVAA